MDFVRKLSRSEAKYKYIQLPREFRETFPEKDVLFDAKFKDKTYKMKVNNSNSIMLTQLYVAHEFQEGDTLTIKSTKKGYDFSVE